MHTHRQVRSSLGIDVDVGLLELLEALWANGMRTQFSCQGGGAYPAHVCFSSVADAHRFADGRFDVTVGTGRAWVDFPPAAIDELAAYWAARSWASTSAAARSPASMAPSR